MSTDIASGQHTIESSDSNVTDLAQSLHNCLELIQPTFRTPTFTTRIGREDSTV